MAWSWKKGCGIGCLVLFSAGVILMGAATWYAREINREYKAVQKSEEKLREALAAAPFAAPAEPLPVVARLDAFLAVRDSLQIQRGELAAASAEFARKADEEQGRGGLKAFVKLLDSGSELAPVYARYWSRRNDVLLEYGMDPDEYRWYYTLVYYKWLGKDPDAGRGPHTTAPPPSVAIPGELSPAAQDLLAPRRMQAEANFEALVNPVELIFAGDTEE